MPVDTITLTAAELTDIDILDLGVPGWPNPDEVDPSAWAP